MNRFFYFIIVFTKYIQLAALDAFFQECDSPNSAQLTRFASALGLDFAEVRVWFCNRRQKRRKTVKKEPEEDVLSQLENQKIPISVRAELQKKNVKKSSLIESLDRMPKEEVVIKVKQEED